jgi:hypothetical protein
MQPLSTNSQCIFYKGISPPKKQAKQAPLVQAAPLRLDKPQYKKQLACD